MHRHMHTQANKHSCYFAQKDVLTFMLTHTNTLFPSLTPNNSVVTSQIYSITATNPLTPPFFLIHLSILFILPLTGEHLAHYQEHFLGFQSGASCYLKKNIFYLSFVLECQTRITQCISVFVHCGSWRVVYYIDLRDKKKRLREKLFCFHISIMCPSFLVCRLWCKSICSLFKMWII